MHTYKPSQVADHLKHIADQNGKSFVKTSISKLTGFVQFLAASF